MEAVLGEQPQNVHAAGGEARDPDGHASEIRDGVLKSPMETGLVASYDKLEEQLMAAVEAQ